MVEIPGPLQRGSDQSSYGELCYSYVTHVGIYRVSSSDRTPKDIAHKQITDQYTSVLDVVKTLKERNSPRTKPTRPLQAIY